MRQTFNCYMPLCAFTHNDTIRNAPARYSKLYTNTKANTQTQTFSTHNNHKYHANMHTLDLLAVALGSVVWLFDGYGGGEWVEENVSNNWSLIYSTILSTHTTDYSSCCADVFGPCKEACENVSINPCANRRTYFAHGRRHSISGDILL